MILEALAVGQVVLQVVDLALTRKILGSGGRELNPVLRALGSKWMPVKIGVGFGVTGFMYWMQSIIGLSIVDAMMVGIVVWNARQLRK
jgi:hypothetical protein